MGLKITIMIPFRTFKVRYYNTCALFTFKENFSGKLSSKQGPQDTPKTKKVETSFISKVKVRRLHKLYINLFYSKAYQVPHKKFNSTQA